ncbi:hypothetical protein OsJ_08000 [Oryza sativa Japonica Group]|uniref:Uncharacterized protein n=1 Tax=Oryza sativa subsp. japonica TaxID=39947 RepID=A3AAB1_ORYSJ|nr:hypothetical protein OsJ_08000 [Oryza sativa Japonica Group]
MKAEKAAVAVGGGGGGDEWRCRKHPVARSGGGVCPHCLRDRLLRLCPNCAHVRPCPLHVRGPRPPPRRRPAKRVGRVHTLIEREHRIARSRSVAASSSLAAASTASATAGAVGGRRKARVWGWPPFWEARGQGRRCCCGGGGRGGGGGDGAREVELGLRDGSGGKSGGRGGEGAVGVALPEPAQGVPAPEIVGEHAGARMSEMARHGRKKRSVGMCAALED